jgi:hypothetical protein
MMNRIVVAVGLFTTVLVWCGHLAAQDQEDLASVLTGMEWSASKADVLGYFKERKDGEFKASTQKVRDQVVKESLRRRKLGEYQAIEKSFKRLSGERTGYEVSVITGEFSANNGESLLVVREENAQKYYLFSDGKLWKIIVAYNSEYIQGIGFDAFVEAVIRKYGKPDGTEFDADSGGEGLLRAVWRDEGTELRLENKSDFFNTFTMVYADRVVSERLAKIREAFGDKEETKTPRVRASILDIQEESDFGADDDVVDSLIGGKTDVDIETGRPEEARINRVGATPSAADADLPTETVKKKRKKRKKKKRVRPGIEAKKKKKKKRADDLIIY